MEADIVCGTSRSTDGTPSDSAEVLASPRSINENGHSTLSNKVRSTVTANTDFWTMKLASKVRFSYATIPSRPARPRHLRNPFQPQTSTSPGHLTVIMDAIDSEGDTVEVESPTSDIQKFPKEEKPLVRPALCTPHPPHPGWNDDSSPDHGYDNPYYTRTIADMLWLPRDPLSVLDLDDTVDLRMSITSEPGAGKLGSWNDDDFIGSTLSLPSAFSASFSSDMEDDSASLYDSAPLRLNGDEVISLPAGIASRVENIDEEEEVEEAIQRPSFMQRRTSSSASRATSPLVGIRRPSTFEVGPSSGFRSFSLGAEGTAGAGKSPTSATTTTTHGTSDRRRRNRASTMDAGSSLRPIITRPSTSRQASMSLLSVIEKTPSSVGPSRFLTASPRASSIVSTRDAVVGEVIVEEQEVAQERARQEAEEAQKATKPRSWWTGWAFARPKEADAGCQSVPAPAPS